MKLERDDGRGRYFKIELEPSVDNAIADLVTSIRGLVNALRRYVLALVAVLMALAVLARSGALF